MQITTVGLDLAKEVFHAVCLDGHGKELRKRRLRRREVLKYFAQLPSCVVAMEACSGRHYWARQLQALGHAVKLIPAQHVKPLVQGNKHDYNDARAIAEALGRPKIHFVPVKSAAQQDVQALHRLRSQGIAERTALCNATRGLLGEYGIVLAKGVATLRRRLPEVLEDGDNGLSDGLRRLLARRYEQLRQIDEHIDFYNQELKRQNAADEACRRLADIPGFGPVLSSAFANFVGNGAHYRRGRDVSAALGLVPAQHSSGGKQRLLGISKRGDTYLRGLLIQGARAVLSRARHKQDRLSRWLIRIADERGFNKAVVALANKMARIGWAILRNASTYRLAA